MGNSLDKFTELFQALKENISDNQNAREAKENMIVGSQEIMDVVP